MMHRKFLAGLLLAVSLCCRLLPDLAAAEAPNRFEFIAIADMPYHLPEDEPRFFRLIDAINREQPAFVVHVGDIKAGNTLCNDKTYYRVRHDFERFAVPLVYTPGDNEWTDCDRPVCGFYKPAERLKRLREIFYKTGPALEKSLPLTRQSDNPHYAPFIENARWRINGILFATLHIVGSNNNLTKRRADIQEFQAQNAANLAWLRETFTLARQENAPGVALFIQAEPMFRSAPKRRTGFNDFISTLRQEVLAYAKPVLLVNGDSHVFLIDKPLTSGPARRVIPNFTRVSLFGEQDIHGVRFSVDPDNPDVFSAKPFFIRENLQ